jgi:hypothetical protein
MSMDISESSKNKGIKWRRDKKVLTRPLKSLKRDLELGYLKPQECLDKGLEELMEIIRVELGGCAKNRLFKMRYNGFDKLITLIEGIFPDFDSSSYQRIYDKIEKKLFGFHQETSSY